VFQLYIGYGLNEFFNLMAKLIKMFVLLTLFTYPFMSIYSSYSGLKIEPMYALNMYALGNMGGSSTQCNQVPNAVKGAKIDLGCSTGLLDPYAVDATTG